MATFVTEVICTDESILSTLKKVVKSFCALQTAFKVEFFDVPDTIKHKVSLCESNGSSLYAPDLFELLRAEQKVMRGTHNRIIVFTSAQLNGKVYQNLFSSAEECENNGFTGLAAVTTFNVSSLTNNLPLEGYLFQQLISINIRWVVGRPMLHKLPPNDCLFHKRIEKSLILLAVKEMRLCDSCRALGQSLDDNQWRSLRSLMYDVANAMSADNPRDEMDQLLAKSNKNNFHSLAWRNTDKTLLEDIIDNWRRLRKGKSRYTIAFILAVGGLAAITPPWWQHLLEKTLDITFRYESSPFQQIIGLFVIVLAVVLVIVRSPADR